MKLYIVFFYLFCNSRCPQLALRAKYIDTVINILFIIIY